MKSILFVLCLCILWNAAFCIPLQDFYPFGSDVGDSEVPRTLDGSSPNITLSSPFVFFGDDVTTLFVNTNGHISFKREYSIFTPRPFPLDQNSDLQLIAPYWADVDIRVVTGARGNIWYRQASTDTGLLRQAGEHIRELPFENTTYFEPTFLFIATWDHVGVFVPDDQILSPTALLTNTFQCIMVSDGQRSYVIFLYADDLIEWTTSVDSGGIDGLGGTAAQAGYNAGDGVLSATVPGSLTPEIINITLTSNVGRPGVWTFRVDTDACGSLAPLRINPRLGNQLGGTAITLAGPCFTPEDIITCTFEGGIQMPGMYVSEDEALCVSPYFPTHRWKELTVTIFTGNDSVARYTGETRFYAVSFKDSADVLFHTPSEENSPSIDLLFRPRQLLPVTWDPNSLFPSADSSVLVDISLYSMNLQTGNWSDTGHSSARRKNNTGAYNIKIEPNTILSCEDLANPIVPVVIQVSADIQQGTSANSRALGAAKKWSSLAYFTQDNCRRDSHLTAKCENWQNDQRVSGDDIVLRLPPCPWNVVQARAVNSGLKEDSGVARTLSRNFFHRGADTCFRQTTFPDSSHMGSGQQCCYDRNGSLATGSTSGGTVDLFSPEIDILQHLQHDLLPSIACCHRAQPSCLEFYQHRPSDNSSRYSPPNPACIYGDPHIVTLDGFKYTFNGRGEFDLIRTPLDQFTLQGRMEVPVLPGSNFILATVFTAIVAKEAESDTVQIQLTSEGDSLELLMNGEFVDFNDLPEQEFINVTVAGFSNDTLSARFSSGMYIEVREENGIISTLLVSLPLNYQGETSGLMGNFNGDQEDDLIPRGDPLSNSTLEAIPFNSTLPEIHSSFGVTWIINIEEDSLFTYSSGITFNSLFDPFFVPVFSPTFSSPELEANASAICGEDPFCLFDVAATGSVDIGLSTLLGSIELETIINMTLPVSCSPPCENGVCVADDVCSCSGGYSGERCEEAIFTECDVNPCENGGSCRILVGSYICSCPFGFSGSQCQISELTCPCQRELECSIAGTLDINGLVVTPTGHNLQCVIDFYEDSLGLNLDLQQDGSGFGVFPFAIDNTFDVDFLSAGSYSFLRTLGAISREEGNTRCALEETSESLLEVMRLEQISLIFQEEDGIFDSTTLNMDRLFQSDFSLMGELDEVHACSFQYLLGILSRPPTDSAFFCRNTLDSDLSTVITFRVFCD